MKVRDIITTEVETCGPETTIEEVAADFMANAQVRRLPIVEDHRIVGIVALGDVAVKEDDPEEYEVALEEISKEDKS
ncbi:CBS domain-containing protein [Lacicoccus alkaliphilus]|uniref:CBS domain-containing protein n=1 Tax=Lacicoccus alkaliphilus DSM 16010 TaxID=1123231 RepID=A0A1M7ITC1_9BACL|nr:CBS domain-containing protein [Salinicoccus alkaliphilus]SHM44052.1 CBS domain-containing protein [Salinicoccus alkaliphilus DSM 16010]